MPERLDPLDLNILDELRKNGRVNITDITKRVNSSRPTVTARIRKMQDSGLINMSVGVSLKQLGYKMASVAFEVKQESTRMSLLEKLMACPRVLTIYRMPAKANVTAFLWGENAETITSTVESFRDSDNVDIVKVDFFGTPVHGDVDIFLEPHEREVSPCGRLCSECGRYRSECVGCPVTRDYLTDNM